MFSLIRLSRRCMAHKLLPVVVRRAQISTTSALKIDFNSDDDDENPRPSVVDIDIEKMIEDDPEFGQTFNYKPNRSCSSPATYVAPLVMVDIDEFERNCMEHGSTGIENNTALMLPLDVQEEMDIKKSLAEALDQARARAKAKAEAKAKAKAEAQAKAKAKAEIVAEAEDEANAQKDI